MTEKLQIIINNTYWTECFDNSTSSYYKLIDLLSSAIDRDVKKEKGYEIHHIIPRAFFKHKNLKVDDTKNNLIKLTPAEHYMAHYYMSKCANKIIKHSMIYALHLMTITATKRKCDFSAEQFSIMYEEVKINYAKMQKINCNLKNISKEKRAENLKKAMITRGKNKAYREYLSNRMKGNKYGEGHLKYSLNEMNIITEMYNVGFTYNEINRYFKISHHSVKKQIERAKKKYGEENVIDIILPKQKSRNEIYVYDKLLDNILRKTEAAEKEKISIATFSKKLEDENYRYCVIETMTIADIFETLHQYYLEDKNIIKRLVQILDRMVEVNSPGIPDENKGGEKV